MKKLLMVIPNLCAGGAERQFILNLKYLNKSKFDIYICLFKAEGEYMKYIKSFPVFDLNKRSRFDYMKLVINLRNIIRNVNPDIVYSRLQYSNVITSLALITTNINDHVRHVINEESILSLNLSEKFNGRIASVLVKRLYPYASKIIAPCMASKKDLVNNFNINEDLIDVVYNSIDYDIINMEAFKNNDNFEIFKPIIISVGSLSKIKAHKDLLEAFKIVNKAISCELWILGDGPEKERLKEQAIRLNIYSYVKFFGFQDNPFKFMVNSDVFVLPSLREGVPSVILESMALGLPVISSNVGGVPEIIKNGENGFLIEPKDIKNLSNRIIQLITDKYLWKKYSDNGKKTVIKKFNIKNNVNYLENVFLED